jgi:hypothetical protein
MENGGARDQHVSARRDGLFAVSGLMPPSTSSITSRPHAAMRSARGLDFFQLTGKKSLAAEAGIDSHDQDQVDQVEERIDDLDRRAGIEHVARLLSQRADQLQRAVRMGAGLGMDADDVRAGVRKGGNDRDRPARS